MGDFIVISVLLTIIGLILFFSIKNRKKGGCAGCSKCSGSDSASCSGCCHYNNNSVSS